MYRASYGETMKIIVPMVPPSGNVLRRTYRNPHAYRKLRDEWQSTIRFLLPAGSREVVLGKMNVAIHVEHGRLYDEDNLHSGLKPVIDCLRLLGLIFQDSPKYLDLRVSQERSIMRQTHIEVTPT
jgi:hypothetical protein